MTERYELQSDAVARIQARLARRKNIVKDLAKRIDPQSAVAVVDYLEYRIAAMKDDENVKSELEQIRRDLGVLATATILNKKSARKTSRDT